MLQDLQLPSLQDRRKNNRLIFFYKVVEGLVPAMPCHDFLTPVRKSIRHIKPRTFSDCESINIIDRQCMNNNNCFKPVTCNTDIYKHSYFPRTIIDWNHLEDSVVSAQTLAGFKSALIHRDQCYSSHSLSRCAYAERPCNVFIQIQIQPNTYRMTLGHWVHN